MLIIRCALGELTFLSVLPSENRVDIMCKDPVKYLKVVDAQPVNRNSYCMINVLILL